MARTRTRTLPYLTADGQILMVEVSPAVARVLETTRKQIYRDNERWQYACTSFSTVGIAEELLDHVERPRTYPDDARLWEGPRLHARLLLGYSQPWPVRPLADGRCGACHDSPLPSYAACLWCDRTGIDASIPAVEPSRRPRPPADEGLGGGKGPAQPRSRFPEKAAKRSRTRRKRTA